MVYSTWRFVLSCLVLFRSCVFHSIEHCDYRAWGRERANLSAFLTFVRFALVWFCLFPLPLGVWEGLLWLLHSLDFSLTCFSGYNNQFFRRSYICIEWKYQSSEYKIKYNWRYQTHLCSVRNQWNIIMTHNHKHCDETQQNAQWGSEARTQENHKQELDGFDHRHGYSSVNHLK